MQKNFLENAAKDIPRERTFDIATRLRTHRSFPTSSLFHQFVPFLLTLNTFSSQYPDFTSSLPSQILFLFKTIFRQPTAMPQCRICQSTNAISQPIFLILATILYLSCSRRYHIFISTINTKLLKNILSK